MVDGNLIRVIPPGVEHIDHDLHGLVPHEFVVLLGECGSRNLAVPLPLVAFRCDDVASEEDQRVVQMYRLWESSAG